jgi:hypothetical protein
LWGTLTIRSGRLWEPCFPSESIGKSPRESLIVRPVLLDDVNDVPNSVVRGSHGGASRWQCSSVVHFAGRADRVAAFGAGQFSAEPFQGPRSSHDQVGWGRLLAGLGYWLGWARVGFCGSVTRDKLWSDPHARLELKLIAAAARCPNRSLGQPPRWLLINDSGASRTPVHEIGRKEL